MNLSDDSDDTTPVPQRHTVVNVTQEKRNRPTSPEETHIEEFKAKSPKHEENPHRRRRRMLRETEEKMENKEKLKPRLPKPKKSSIPSSESEIFPSAPPPPPESKIEETQNRKSRNFLKNPRRLSRKDRRNMNTEIEEHKSNQSEEDDDVAPIPSTSSRGGGGNVVGDVRIREILHAFQDDVVTIKSSQRNKWQEKLDGIHAHLLYPEFGHRSSDVVSGGDGGSVPSKWKSASQLVPRDIPQNKNQRQERRGRDQFSILKLFDKIHRISCYSSGLVAGLMTWQIVFTISEMVAGKALGLSSFFWIFYWSLTTLLLLVTVLGFLYRIGLAGEYPWLMSFLQFLFCMIIFATFYGSKALDLQRQECSRYMNVPKEDLQHVHLTYTCNEFVAGENWQHSNYWKISLNFIPAIGFIFIYSILHFFPIPDPDPKTIDETPSGRETA